MPSSIYSGSNSAIDDDHDATRINVAKNSLKDSTATVTIAYAKTNTTSVFNGLGQSAPLSVTFATVGNYDTIGSPINLAGSATPLVTNGEAAYVGATVNAIPLSYNVDALEQRALTLSDASPSFNVLLNGTVAADLVVTSTDKNPAYATNVTVAGGGYTLGALTAQSTEVDSVNSTDIPLTGTFTGSGYDGTFTGSGYTTKASASGALPVVTAEQASVGDTKAYRALTVGYTANVGFATADANPSGLTDFGAATTLSSFVAPGTSMKNLELTVANSGKAVGMAADITTTPASLNTPRRSPLGPRSLDGLVGSTATMSPATRWPPAPPCRCSRRARVAQETGSGSSPPLPAGYKWLTSDVVQISGLGNATTGPSTPWR